MDGPQKAIVGGILAAVLAGLAVLASQLEVLGDGAGLGDISTLGWVLIVIAVITEVGAVFGGVYYTTNKPAS